MAINKQHYEDVKLKIQGKAELCIVSKKRSREDILQYYAMGERIFGENHAQELLTKTGLPEDICWHFIGHLQRNKVRSIVPYVSMIQSLDSLELAKVIDKECARIGKVMPVLAEFHLALEDTNKTGLSAEDAVSFLRDCQKYEHLDIRGIMAMGPHTENTDEIARIFEQGHGLYLDLQKIFGSDKIQILSMGMSDDFTIALDHGSTLVRIGSYLFED